MNRQGYSSTSKSSQNIDNLGLDREFGIPMTEPLGYDGQSLQRMLADSLDQKIVTDDGDTYIALAAPGTSESDEKWQVKRVSVSGNTTTITFAGGTAGFVHTATDLPGLFT